MPRAYEELGQEEEALLSQPGAPPPAEKEKRSIVASVLLLVGLGLALLAFWGLTHLFDKPGVMFVRPKTFSVVDGFFKQSSWDGKIELGDVYGEDYHFGIVDADWAAFKARVEDLKKNAGPDEQYLVLFNARHGQGFHNLKEAEVGTEMWDCKWSLLETDGNITWGPDPQLTALGEEQAKIARDAWTTQLAKGAPMPDIFLSSPFTRAAKTCEITWAERTLPSPVQIWEGWRECIGLHTCDKRRTRSYLEKTFPHFDIEPGFKEEDELWTADLQEPNEVQAYRIHLALERIFQEYQNATYISTTSHGGSINGLMDAVGHGRVPIMTGGMLPVVIKAVPANFPLHPPLVEWHTAPPCPAAG